MSRDDQADAALGAARARRWWVRGRRIRSIERAATFIDDVGFALLFPSERLLVPTLWEAVAGEDAEPFATGMDADEQRVWSWKDELPRRGLAWYGGFVGGRGSFLSPGLLQLLYPGDGTEDDHQSLDLSPTAHEIALALVDGPLPSATLRVLVGDRNRYQRAATELQRSLIVTTAGVVEQSSGWPSSVLDLTCRRFEVGSGRDPAAAADRFLDVILQARAADLSRALRWTVPEARQTLDALVEVRPGDQAGQGLPPRAHPVRQGMMGGDVSRRPSPTPLAAPH